MIKFLTESNHIEGIYRGPTQAELEAFETFLQHYLITVGRLCALQEVFAPGKPLRDKAGMDVRVGNHVAPRGGASVPAALGIMLDNLGDDPWLTHCEFQTLHPFMDGNGRTGRMLWARHMQAVGRDPFALSFLHRFYYQTLEHGDGR